MLVGAAASLDSHCILCNVLATSLAPLSGCGGGVQFGVQFSFGLCGAGCCGVFFCVKKSVWGLGNVCVIVYLAVDKILCNV